jgi:thioredoxin reductase (NADPH)
LGVPGEDTSKVVYNLSDAEAYRGKALCIVGGGDSAVEAVNGLARPDLENRVWLVYRGGGFSAAKARNQKKLKKYVDDGRVTVLLNSTVAEIRERSVVVKTAEGLEELDNDFLFAMLGGESPKQFLSECGIEFSERALG